MKSLEVAVPSTATGLMEEKTSVVQAGSLKSRKVMVPVLAPGPNREAVSRTGVPTGPPADGWARTSGLALRMTTVNVWQAGGETPSVAHTVVGPKVPAWVGRPFTIPEGPMRTPGGRAPLVTE